MKPAEYFNLIYRCLGLTESRYTAEKGSWTESKSTVLGPDLFFFFFIASYNKRPLSYN